MPLMCIWFLRDCGPARMHALPGWPGWQAIAQEGGGCVCSSAKAVCAWLKWKGSLKASELYLIRLKILTSEAFNSDSPKEGGAQTPHSGLGWLTEPRFLRGCVLIHPECHLGLWVWLYGMWLQSRKACCLPLLICIPVLYPPLLSCVFVLLICKTGLDLWLVLGACFY